jgi:hypothetical protein
VSREVWSALEEPTVNTTSRISQLAARPRPAASALLGIDHPLVRDLERLAVLRRQASVVAAVFVGSAAALYEGASAAIALVVGAAATQLLLACRGVVVRESGRAHVLDLISEGHAALPIPAVEHMCARLRRERHRRRLARSVEALLDAKIGGFDVATTPWRFMRTDLVAPIRHELSTVAALLRDDDAGVSGIAMLERLLCDGSSSLHSDNPRLVRDDLRRARFLLANRA